MKTNEKIGINLHQSHYSTVPEITALLFPNLLHFIFPKSLYFFFLFTGRFIPLLVRAPGSAVYPASGQKPAPGMDNNQLEITYPNGTTLRIRQTLDLAGLRSLVSLLD